MASRCMMLIFVQMFALMFVTGFCWESSVGNNDSDTSGSDEELDPTLVVLSEVIAVALFLFGLILGALDYRWAPRLSLGLDKMKFRVHAQAAEICCLQSSSFL
mmetsp:Transcript_65918/g.115330  ORF Transcript_65918/g.115330 Transcript_65918/m.115330 type:complete len:103 (-) Transcript_65918:1081-1389(-)